MDESDTLFPGLSGNGSSLEGVAYAVVDGHGVIVGWSSGARLLLGYTAQQAQGLHVADLLRSADDGPRVTGRCRREGSVFLGEVALRHRDGRRVDTALWAHHLQSIDGERWLVQGESASAARLDDLRDALLRGLFTESPFIIDVFDARLRLLAQNRSRSRAPGFVEDTIGRTMREAAPEGLLDMSALEDRQRRVLTEGEALIGTEVRGRDPRDPDRDTVWSETILPLRSSSGEVVALAHMVFDVTEEARARERLSLVNEAGARIGSSLDVLHTAQELTDVAVPWFADHAYVNLLNATFTGQEPVSGPVTAALPLRRAAASALHGDAANLEVATGEIDHFASTPDSLFVRALTATEPVLLSGEELITELAVSDARRAALVREQDVRSWLLVPMQARGAALGAVVFARSARARSFEGDDVVLAKEFVARAGVCIDNASRYSRERSTAMALQRSLLPQRLPALGRGIEVASRYLPADNGAGLGGAWFDVFPLSGARVALVVGDAGGSGLQSAVTMGRLRTAVRTLADLDLPPEELLTHLDDQVKRWGSGGWETTATCLFAIFDPLSRRCAVASAGHPLPVIIGAGGQLRFTDTPAGVALATGGVPFEGGEVTLTDGDRLLLYTAGLLRSWADEDDDARLDRMREALTDPAAFTSGLTAASAPAGPLPALGDVCEAIVRTVPAHRHEAVAVLLAQVRGLAPENHVTWEVAAEPESVGRARAGAVDQLTTWHLDDLTFTTELLVSELVTNAIRHATPPVRLRLIRDRSLICEVSDGSSTSPHVRRALETDEGGRGLFMVAQLAQLWGTRYHDRGKTIWAEQPLPSAGNSEGG